MSKWNIFLATAILSSGGCVTGPDYRKPEIILPESWPEHAVFSLEQQEEWSDWWSQFGDPVLDQLVRQALDRNLEILVQTARVEEFRARLGLAQAERLPTVAGQAGVSRERLSGAAAGIPGLNPGTSNLFSIAGLLHYEIDLWGRLAREREAAGALLRQNVFARDAVRLSITADVATAYFDYRATQRKISITRETIDSRRETLRLQEIRHEAGDIDDLVLQQARGQLELARADLPLLIQGKQALHGSLAVLTGVEPSGLWEELPWEEDQPADLRWPAPVPAFLPSELLNRRPDLRAAESSLQAATAGIGIAQAQRLPRINLSAMLGTAAASAGDLFTSPAETWSLGAEAAGTVWDFGRTRSRVETAEAIAAQAEARYRLTVAGAFNEVRDALVFHETSAERTDANRRLVSSMEKVEQLAAIRHREGFISFLEFLDAQRGLLSARLALEDAKRDQMTAAATLFKALGGGWTASENGPD